MTDTTGGTPGRMSLEESMTAAGGPVNLLRSSPIGRFVFPVTPPEFGNWRDEQRAWKEGCSLLELSYHMNEVHVKGPGAQALIASLGVNKFNPFPVKRAKQLIMADHAGYYLADAILFHEEEEFFRICGAPMAGDWVQYNAGLGKFDVEVSVDLSYVTRSGPRDVFRFQIQGPNALQVLREATDGKLPETGFFHISEIQIAGHAVRALRHGMAGEPGFEIYGPWEAQAAVREAVERIGANYAMRKAGSEAYATPGIESGWMPLPLPALYHSAEMKPYREWLNTSNIEAIASLGGSFYSENIEDYYLNPFEIGYGPMIDFEHEFIGRDALVERSKANNRKKVTLVWNPEDVMEINRAALFDRGERPRYINTPSPVYSTFQCDAVMQGDKSAGVSQWSVYTANAQAYISHGVLAPEFCEPGTELTLLWGDDHTTRPSVEKHVVRPIRVTVAPSPYFQKVIKTGKQ